MQNKNDASSSKANQNKSRNNQSIPEEQQLEAMSDLVDQYSDVLKLRSHLRKYFYPKKTNLNIRKSVIHQLWAKCKCRGLSNKLTRKRYCLLNHRNRFTKKKYLRFCHECKQTIRGDINASSDVFHLPLQKSPLSYNQSRMLKQRSSQTIVVNPYVVSRLKHLGTTVICEGTSATADNDLSRSITNNTKKIDKSVIQNVIRSSSNEFVISFNTVLQEVFPVDLSEKMDAVADVDDFKEIFKRIPKSLSITVA